MHELHLVINECSFHHYKRNPIAPLFCAVFTNAIYCNQAIHKKEKQEIWSGDQTLGVMGRSK